MIIEYGKLTVKLNLCAIDKVKKFSEYANKVTFDMDLSSERYTVDAKSIMGIFSLDIIKPLTLVIYSDYTDEVKDFLELISKYIINEAQQ